MIAIVKYNAGNIQSVQFALQRLGIEAIWTDDPDLLRTADKVIFPGVGEASSAMRYLRERGLDGVLRNLQQPVLGICLGLQLFCRHSEEGDTPCLGIFDVEVRRFHGTAARRKVPNSSSNTQIDHIDHIDPIHLKVPHMGWNTLAALRGPLFEGLRDDNYVYFVHSFYAALHSGAIARTDYGVPFSAALQRDNFYAVQFHPEKSGPMGQRILKNFLNL